MKIYKYNIDPSIFEVLPDLKRLVAQYILPETGEVKRATSNKDQIFDNLHNRLLVPDGEDFIITDLKGNPREFLMENSENGFAWLWHNTPNPVDATKKEAWNLGDYKNDVCNANPCIESTPITANNGATGYLISTVPTLVNGQTSDVAERNIDFRFMNTNFGIMNAEIAGQIRDGLDWIGGVSFMGYDVDNQFIFTKDPNYPTDGAINVKLFADSDIIDADEEELIVTLQNGAGVGKGTFGWMKVPVKTICPTFFNRN